VGFCCCRGACAAGGCESRVDENEALMSATCVCVAGGMKLAPELKCFEAVRWFVIGVPRDVSEGQGVEG
jgi:hypothetical protein